MEVYYNNKNSSKPPLDTHNVKEAIKSEVEKLNPALYLVNFPVAVSNETSVPRARVLFPATPEKLTRGLAVSPMLVLIPAYSCRYWSSTCSQYKYY